MSDLVFDVPALLEYCSTFTELLPGDIIATGRVEITETAKIAGTVSARAIAVAEGAIVEGVMRTAGQTDPTEFVEKREEDDD